MLLLLSGDIILNLGPTSVFSSPFGNLLKIRDFIFLHLIINSILPKLDKLRTISGNTEAAIYWYNRV